GLWLAAPASTMEARLRARRHDASDASPEVITQQLRQYAGPVDWLVIDGGTGPEDCLTTARRALALGRTVPPPSDRRRFSTGLLCLNLLRDFRALLRTELFCPRLPGPLNGRAERPRRLLVVRSILLQSAITGHPDLLLQRSNLVRPATARLDPGQSRSI